MADIKTTPAGPATKGVRVVSRPNTFRRAGFVFGAEPTTIPLDKLTDAQLEQLRAEPNLVVVNVDIEPPKATK